MNTSTIHHFVKKTSTIREFATKSNTIRKLAAKTSTIREFAMENNAIRKLSVKMSTFRMTALFFCCESIIIFLLTYIFEKFIMKIKNTIFFYIWPSFCLGVDEGY